MGIKMQAHQSQNTFDVMKEQGFYVEQEFTGIIPQMPFDITDLDDLGVMRLWQEYNAYLAFILAQVTAANMDESANKKYLDLIEAQFTAKHTQPKMTVSAVKALVAMEPDVQAVESAYDVTHNYRKGMEMLYTNIERDCAFISRELTRRTSGGFSRVSKFTT
jgi:type VI protein secretion system component VasK